jgi:hypothetical protein
MTRTRLIGLAAAAVVAGGALGVYAIAKPTSFVVLSVADGGTMELQLHFAHS